MATQDEDDPPQRESEREMDMALSDFETQEVGEVSEALRRIETDAYGLCSTAAPRFVRPPEGRALGRALRAL
ncbi:MAG: hypothetical protein U1F67_05370 [Rubrivivax sp.]